LEKQRQEKGENDEEIDLDKMNKDEFESESANDSSKKEKAAKGDNEAKKEDL